MQATGWPHSPKHHFPEQGAYIVTAATHLKAHHFRTTERLDVLTRHLHALAGEYGWDLQAWAVFSNHYHFVAHSPTDPKNLPTMLNQLHSDTAREINELDGAVGRQVWFNYWDTHLTYQRSYLARLNYMHHNPMHHGLVGDAEVYPWCSAAWFGAKAPAAFARTVRSFRIDQISVRDPFEPVLPGPGSALVNTKAVTGHRTP